MRIRRSPNIQTSQIDHCSVVYDPPSDHYVMLDEGGSRTWDALDGADTVADIVASLARKGSPRSTEDVESDISELRRLGLVRAPRMPAHDRPALKVLSGPAFVGAFAALSLALGAGPAWGIACYNCT